MSLRKQLIESAKADQTTNPQNRQINLKFSVIISLILPILVSLFLWIFYAINSLQNSVLVLDKKLSEMNDHQGNQKNNIEYIQTQNKFWQEQLGSQVRDLTTSIEGNKKSYDRLNEEQIKTNGMVNQLLSLKEQVGNTQTQLLLMQKDFYQLSEQVSSLKEISIKAQNQIETILKDNSTQQLLTNSQTLNIEHIKQDIQNIYIQQQVNTSLSNDVTNLKLNSLAIQNFSPKIEGMSVTLEHLKQDFQNIYNSQQTLFQSFYSLPNNSTNNLSSEITSIKSSIADLQTSMQEAGVLNSIKSYGPFVASSSIQVLSISDYNIVYYQTTQSCLITVQSKAVVTLIATGLGISQSRWTQISFLKDRVMHLSSANSSTYLDGAGYLDNLWLPINLTQEFYVEKGTYEFQLAFRLPAGGSATLSLESLSFIAKVTHYT